MPGISPTGSSGSNIDVKGLVDKLIKAEGGPTVGRLDKQEAKIQADISAMGAFRSALSDFQNTLGKLRKPEDMRKMSATTSDKDKIEITASPEAQEGSYNVEALQLAQAQRLTSDIFDSDLNPIGKGSLTFQFGKIDPQTGKFVPNAKATVKTIQITDTNNSLRGIKGAINEANFGVRASLINGEKGTRLVLSGENTGEINAMRIVVHDADGSDFDRGGLSRLSYDPTQPGGKGINMIESAKAQDAVLRIDGIEIANANNNFDKAIDGVNINVKAVTGDHPVKLSTSFDVAGVTTAIEDFVKTYNAMINNVQNIAGYDPKTKTAGPLAGDAAVRGIVDQIRRTISTSFGGINPDFNSLSSIGISTQNDGTLTIDSGKLRHAVEEDMVQVSKLFARAGSATDPLIRYVKADDDSRMGAYDVYITRLATQGHYIGGEPAFGQSFQIAEGKNQLVMKVDGVTSDEIKLPGSNYTSGQEVAEALQRAINSDETFKRNNVSVSVKYLADQFVISSKREGSASRVDVMSSGADIRDLGIDPAEGLAGEDVHGTIGGEPANGHGQNLTGRGKAAGIEIEVLGGKTGARGQVSYSRGVAEQLGGLLDNYLGSSGLLDTRNKGYQHRIEDITHQRDDLNRRLSVSRERLMKKFSNLDETISRMHETSNYLTNQLAHLPGAGKPG
ncbi:MAG: flagellar filament capping protein FliD [Gammaproteobacteria bacterium]|nr:flagellar filament capping protein FliD [Gammaproteobacteria bacterium]